MDEAIPSSALLEVLDPEQNSEFSDHYLEVPLDLSKVLFIATANVIDTVPAALRDRMEVIELPGYTLEEKVEIAKGFLVPRQVERNGIGATGFELADDAVVKLIESYTREAGVRNLEREIGAVCRKIARKVAEGEREGPSRSLVPILRNCWGRSRQSRSSRKMMRCPASRSDSLGHRRVEISSSSSRPIWMGRATSN